MSLENQVRENMETALHHLHKELRGLRTGRANPALVEGVIVEVYGTQMPIKELANITVPESRQLLISPYDGNNAGAIGKAIEAANLGVQPIVDGNTIRVNFPMMDKTVRQEMVKQCGKKAEEAKIAIREVRRKFKDQLKKEKDSGDMPEDIKAQKEKKLQELTDHYCKQCEEASKAKEKEILEI